MFTTPEVATVVAIFVVVLRLVVVRRLVVVVVVGSGVVVVVGSGVVVPPQRWQMSISLTVDCRPGSVFQFNRKRAVYQQALGFLFLSCTVAVLSCRPR